MTLPIVLPSNIRMIGENGQFYTVLTVQDPVMFPDNVQVRQTQPSEVISLVNGPSSGSKPKEDDIFICGRCKASFYDLEEFCNHKVVCGGTSTSLQQPLYLSMKNSSTVEENQIMFMNEGEIISVSMEDTPVEIINDDTPSILLENYTNPSLTMQSSVGTVNTLICTESKKTLEKNIPMLKDKEKQMITLVEASENHLGQSSDHVLSGNKGSENQICPSTSQIVSVTEATEPQDISVAQRPDNESRNQILSVAAEGPENQIPQNADQIVSVASGQESSDKNLQDLYSKSDSADNGYSSDLLISSAGTMGHQSSLTLENFSSVNSSVPKDRLLCMSSQAQTLLPVSREDRPDCKPDHPDRKFFCTYCNKSFKKSFDLSQHVRCHTGEKPFQCVICGRGFAQKSNVKKHMITHKVWPKGKPVLPESVAKLYTDAGDRLSTEDSEFKVIEASEKDGLKKKREITVQKFYSCPYCKAKLSKHTEYKSHLLNHQEEKCYRCIVPNCGKMFSSIEQYVDHTTGHKNMVYSCHVCPDKFTDLNDLNLHQYTHLTDKDTREKQVFECKQCRNKYTSSGALDYHIETDSHSYPCDVCSKEFTALRYLRKHIASTHNEGSFKCNVCSKLLKNEHYLKVHKLIHTGDLPFSCNECGAKFNRKDKLKRHTLIHNSQKQFKCPFKEHMNCEKEFHRFDKLKLHIMTHGNIKPFKCDICDVGFTRKEHLKVHREKQHLEDSLKSLDNCENENLHKSK